MVLKAIEIVHVFWTEVGNRIKTIEFRWHVSNRSFVIKESILNISLPAANAVITFISDTAGVSESSKLNVNDDAVTLFPFNPNTMLSDDVGDTYESNLTVSKIYRPFLDLNRKLYEIIKTRFQSIESLIFKGKLPSSTALTILAPTHS